VCDDVSCSFRTNYTKKSFSKVPSRSILNDAVYVYMTDIGEGHHEDVIRTFFRNRVGDIGQLIRKVPHVIAKASQESGHSLADFLPEANQIVLVRVLVVCFRVD
jgi:hypothetical protein